MSIFKLVRSNADKTIDSLGNKKGMPLMRFLLFYFVVVLTTRGFCLKKKKTFWLNAKCSVTYDQVCPIKFCLTLDEDGPILSQYKIFISNRTIYLLLHISGMLQLCNGHIRQLLKYRQPLEALLTDNTEITYLPATLKLFPILDL